MPLDLTKYLFIDNHAHSLLKRQSELDAFSIRRAFSESHHRQSIANDLPQSLHYRHMLRELGEFLSINNETQLVDLRSTIPQSEYVRTLFDDVYMIAAVIDDGYQSEEFMPLSELAAISGRTVFLCRRIEQVIERSIKRSNNFDACLTALNSDLIAANPAIPVALKTIMAYRGGLTLDIVSTAEAQSDFSTIKQRFDSGHTRIERCPLYHYLLRQAFELAGKHDLPVQIHTGLGDDDAFLAASDPAQFQPVLKLPNLAQTKFVFLHCYPFVRQAAILCSLYPNVYMDLSLAISLAAPMASQLILEALAVAAPTKLLAGTDGHSCPESHWYGAVTWKLALSQALEYLERRRLIDNEQATDIASAILHANAIKLYKLEGLV